MKKELPKLYSIVPANNEKPVAPSFLAVRSKGNILFGNGAAAVDYFTEIEKLGSVIGVYIGDRHHGKSDSPAAKHFKIPLCCSEEEAKVIKKKSVTIDQVIEYQRHKLFPDLEVIPTPGHTLGALSYLWKTGNNKVLFIGDTIVRVDGEWKVWVSKKNAPVMLKTMEMLDKMEFTHLAVGSFAQTGELVVKMSKSAKKEMIKSVVSALDK